MVSVQPEKVRMEVEIKFNSTQNKGICRRCQPSYFFETGLYPPQLINHGMVKQDFQEMVSGLGKDLQAEDMPDIFPRLQEIVADLNKSDITSKVEIVASEKSQTPTTAVILLEFIPRASSHQDVPVAEVMGVKTVEAGGYSTVVPPPQAVLVELASTDATVQTTCSSALCNVRMEAGTRYCPSCGDQQADWVQASAANVAPVERFVMKRCVKCGVALRSEQEFTCEACIQKAETVVECVSCAERIAAGSETCTYCGAPQMKECVLCGKRNISASSSAFDCASCSEK